VESTAGKPVIVGEGQWRLHAPRDIESSSQWGWLCSRNRRWTAKYS